MSGSGVFFPGFKGYLESKTGNDNLDDIFDMYGPKISRSIHDGAKYSREAVEAVKSSEENLVEGIKILNKNNNIRTERLEKKIDDLTSMIKEKDRQMEEKDRQIAQMHEILKNFPKAGALTQERPLQKASNFSRFLPGAR